MVPRLLGLVISAYKQVWGIGDICIQTCMGCTLTLKDVRHIPNLRLNLISVHMLDKDGYNHFINSGN